MEGPHHLSEEEACIRVARTEFQDICGFQCDPGRCDGNKLPAEELPSTYCGCKYCTHDVWQRKTENGHTCGARISFLSDFNGLELKEACAVVGGEEFPNECGASTQILVNQSLELTRNIDAAVPVAPMRFGI